MDWHLPMRRKLQTALIKQQKVLHQHLRIPYKDVGNIPVTFPHQPPLVPHSIRGLQVTKNANQCLGCHSPDVAPTTGAPRVPEATF